MIKWPSHSENTVASIHHSLPNQPETSIATLLNKYITESYTALVHVSYTADGWNPPSQPTTLYSDHHSIKKKKKFNYMYDKAITIPFKAMMKIR